MPRRPAPKPPLPTELPQHRKARLHLARRDPVMKRLIGTVGRCTLWYNTDAFAALVMIIVSQQISTKAAKSIHAKLLATFGPVGVTPAGLLLLSDEEMRGAGLSAGKVRSMRDLATKVVAGEVALDTLTDCDDDAVIERLVTVRGIGPWSAQMVLIFTLGRLDILPVGDLGVRASVKREYELPELPGKAELTELAEPWRPYRSIATWYLWKSSGFVPQSEPPP